jgi:endogenous inhibitor of DNA gyrase (YacG/DUF329 family)
MSMKAPERPCRHCGATLPAEPSGPGRPKLFCSRRCRRDFYLLREKADRERERDEERKRRWERTYGHLIPAR